MPRVLPPCFRRKQLGRHIRFASRAVFRYARSHVVHTYIPQVAYLFSSFDMLCVCVLVVCTKVVCTKDKAQNGTTPVDKKKKKKKAQQYSKNNEMKPKISKRKKIPVPFRVINYYLSGTPYTSQKKKKKKKRKNLTAELSQPRTPPAPLATISPPIQSG